MDVSSVTSSLSSALATNVQARSRQAEQDQQVQSAPPPQQSGQAQGAQQAQSSQRVDESESAARSRPETESARPTVNTNGQVVGTRINTTA